ncbi:HDIG domain-containing protein [Anaerovirgula multivorans]|uniref:HDIG domain-containing protein n=1 Tax=Anaerovirgula multivorans TaxID=312168 RepID=A0A239GZU6_9FIRM|nr:HD domain-containing protein [Anaerovirgula multivorans]SNS74746.1 HDIG domain-containing protein [Anaerovirgula multivorans]
MIYRVKQFFQGLTAKLYEEDLHFINQYLTSQEQNLFFQLRKSEQRHSINVAYGCKIDAPNNLALIKAALLHDVGKIGSNLTLINKAFVVLSDKMNLKPSVMPSFLKEAMYYKINHAKLGYELLLKLGLQEKVLVLVKNHHKENIANVKEMEILQHYDNLY